MGVDGQRVSAGLGYDFGAFDTRLGYSLVERGTTEETSFVTLGSQLTLRPWLVLQGDLAYAEEQQGETATAGRVTLRLNF